MNNSILMFNFINFILIVCLLAISLHFYFSPTITCLPVTVPIVELSPNDTLTPLDKRFPGYYCGSHDCTILKEK